MFWNRRIYLDYASATPVLSEAHAVAAHRGVLFGNPGSIHSEGVQAERLLQEARSAVAKEIACKPRELIFTSGGTEGNNLAILGYARNLLLRGDDLTKTHWIVSAIEHPSVLECFGEIERLGGRVTHIDPDRRGIISPNTVLSAVRPETVFVSIGWANHEIGVVQPIRDIVRAVREMYNKILFHSDAGQAPLYLSPQVHTLGVDLMTFDSGKLYGPRGIGVLYIHNRVELAPLLLGGGQERGLRAGTENVALAAGFAAAFAHISKERVGEARRLRALRDAFARDLRIRFPESILNGDEKRCLPHMLNISIPNIQSEYITLALDRASIAISTKSACKEGEERISRVVESLSGAEELIKTTGTESWRSRNTLRFSLGRDSREKDLKKTAQKLTEIIAKSSA